MFDNGCLLSNGAQRGSDVAGPVLLNTREEEGRLFVPESISRFGRKGTEAEKQDSVSVFACV